MKPTLYKKGILGIMALMAGMILYSCASIGNPSGGPRDEDPPRFVKAYPPSGSVNINPKRINIDFNEIVNVKDASTKVVMSPPSRRPPRVVSQGRRVTVTFQDTLESNTTYTIDFADAIEDNNEGNKLQNFTYSFSTGESIDTLMASGMVLSARNLEPMQGILVGVHSNRADTAFTKTPFLRVARTDDRGRFTIRGLRQEAYRIFALDDKDNDYAYANPEEDLAFSNISFVPSASREETLDTIWNLKTGEVDTVMSRMRTRYFPNDLLLRTFNVELKPQYITDYQRIDSTRLSLKFNSPASRKPLFELLNAREDVKEPIIVERNLRNDSIMVWLRPESLVRQDTLLVGVTYQRLDSNNVMADYADTLRFVTNRPKPKKVKASRQKETVKNIVSPGKQKADSLRAITLGINVLSSSTMDVNVPLVFEFETPLSRLDTSSFRLLEKVDTTYRPVKKEYRFLPYDSVSVRKFKIEYPWVYGKSYRFEADTLAAQGIYGKQTLPLTHDFTMKEESEYTTVTFNLSGYDFPEQAFVELLSGSDEVVRSVRVEDNMAFFPFLAPGRYYARIIQDFNGNGVYDTGDYSAHISPDEAFYYPKAINLKKNWAQNINWNVFETAVDLMKPDAIKKNKPATTKGRLKDKPVEEEEEELFDPTRNPFDPNDKPKNRSVNGLR